MCELVRRHSSASASTCIPHTIKVPITKKKYFGAANQYYQYLSILTPDKVLQWVMSRVWGCEASQGIAQVSAERELSVKAARECSEVGRGYMESASWVVASDQKQSRTLQRSAKLRRSGRLGRERIGFELLRPCASAARWGMQGMNLTELPRPSEMRVVDPVCHRATVGQKTVHGQHSNRLYPFPGTYDFVEVVKGRLKVHYSELLLSV
ncbi:hypothetical protein EDB86DRAFT_2835041 [Lactarius hatsudake]|nr:hypothetical protein EDB86DRAFT_2835041 [Lactarius hatsudake]